MKCQFVLTFALAYAVSSYDFWEDDAGVSLLQLSSLKSGGHGGKSDVIGTAIRINGTTSAGVPTRCQAVGDVHVDSWINGQTHLTRKNPMGPGLYPLITRKDGSEAVQFYQFACAHWGSFQACAFMNSLAFKFNDVIVRIHPDMDEPSKVIVCLNDEPVWSPDKPDNSPKDRDGYCKWLEHRIGVIPGTEGPDQVVLSGGGNRPTLTKASTGFTASIWGGTHRGYTAADGAGRSSYEMAVEIEMTDAIEGGMDVCFSDPALWLHDGSAGSQDVKHNDITFEDYESWKARDDPATPFVESPMFTVTDLEMFCNKGNWVNGKTCHDANLPVEEPEPTPEEACEGNNCPFDMAQAMCSSLRSHQNDYDECLFDYCTTCDESAVEVWESSEGILHPQPTCASGMDDCNAADICAKSLTMNTLTLAQNNLGGVGPGSGAEELRYSKAANVNGQSVDLIVTARSAYSASKPSATGVAGAFGSINVKCNTEVTLLFKVVDSETGDAVTLDNVALTWYDIDEGKKGKGRSTVTACGDGLLTSSSSELAIANHGSCWSATSSVAGTKADNPSDPFTLTRAQRQRVATFPFSGVSQFVSTLNVEKGFGGRNFQFAIEPGVACTGRE